MPADHPGDFCQEEEEAPHHHTRDGQAAEDLFHPHSVLSLLSWTPIQDARGETIPKQSISVQVVHST